MRSAARAYWPRSGLLMVNSSLQTWPGWAAELDLHVSAPPFQAGTILEEVSPDEFGPLDPAAPEAARAISVFHHPGGAGPAVAVIANARLDQRAAILPEGISPEARQAAIDALASFGIVVDDDGVQLAGG